jgi:beta-glucosidase
MRNSNNDRDRVSVFPAGINVAATFDKGLMYKRAKAMGAEFKQKGVHVALAPMTNMGRVAAGGRNWEGFGGDPVRFFRLTVMVSVC